VGARERRRRVRSSFSSLSLSSSQKQKHHTTMMVAVSSFLARAFGLDGLRRQNTSLSPERERREEVSAMVAAPHASNVFSYLLVVDSWGR
jgi:hypothetical protein